MLSQPKSAMAGPQSNTAFENADRLLEQKLAGSQFH
jgi:hypothetical protein